MKLSLKPMSHPAPLTPPDRSTCPIAGIPGQAKDYLIYLHQHMTGTVPLPSPNVQPDLTTQELYLSRQLT